MASTADSDDKKLLNKNQFCPILFFLEINVFTSVQLMGTELVWFSFKFFAAFPQFDGGDTEWDGQTFFSFFSARRQRCTSDALINIYGRVFDAALKVPSTQHLTAASLYGARPSPRSPVLKQSIIKEQLSAITLSDPNGKWDA